MRAGQGRRRSAGRRFPGRTSPGCGNGSRPGRCPGPPQRFPCSFRGRFRPEVYLPFPPVYPPAGLPVFPATGGVHAPATDAPPGRLGLRPGVQFSIIHSSFTRHSFIVNHHSDYSLFAPFLAGFPAASNFLRYSYYEFRNIRDFQPFSRPCSLIGSKTIYPHLTGVIRRLPQLAAGSRKSFPYIHENSKFRIPFVRKKAALPGGEWS